MPPRHRGLKTSVGRPRAASRQVPPQPVPPASVPSHIPIPRICVCHLPSCSDPAHPGPWPQENIGEAGHRQLSDTFFRHEVKLPKTCPPYRFHHWTVVFHKKSAAWQAIWAALHTDPSPAGRAPPCRAATRSPATGAFSLFLRTLPTSLFLPSSFSPSWTWGRTGGWTWGRTGLGG